MLMDHEVTTTEMLIALVKVFETVYGNTRDIWRCLYRDLLQMLGEVI